MGEQMKRNRYQIAAGILEIVAGAFMACNVAFTAALSGFVGGKVEWYLYILPFVYLYEGILYCLRKGILGELLLSIVLNITLIIVELCSHGVLAMGVLCIGLLAVASLFLLLSLADVDYGLIDYIKKRKEPVQVAAKTVQSAVKVSQPLINVPDHDRIDFVAVTDPTEDVPPTEAPAMDVTAKLQILKKLYDTGALTAEEYRQQKLALLHEVLE